MIDEITVVNLDVKTISDHEQSKFVNVANDIYKLKQYCKEEINTPLIVSNQSGNFLVMPLNTNVTHDIIEKYQKDEVLSNNIKIKILTRFFI